MAVIAGSTIKIKRSTTSGAPGTLAPGELAYSGLTGNIDNGGDRLYIGIGGTGASADDVFTIGGKYFTDMLDQAPGILTASSAIVVDGNKKIDELYINKIKLSSNIVSTSPDEDLIINPTGVNTNVKFYSGSDSWYLPRARGAAGQVLMITDANDGKVEWQKVSTTLRVTADTGTDSNGIDLNDDANSFNFRGDRGITTVFSDNTMTISGVWATTTSLGVSKFDPNQFTVNATPSDADRGKVSIQDGYIKDTVGGMVDGNTETNVEVTYSNESKLLSFVVSPATLDNAGTPKAGVAKFDHEFFTIASETVSLAEEVINNVTVGGTAIGLSSNTLAFTTNGIGITLSGSGASNAIDISGAYATKAAFGVAKFSEDYFSFTTPGIVKINAATNGTDTGAGTAATLGLSRFSSTHFDVSGSGFVEANSIYVGNAVLTLAPNDTTATYDLTGLNVVGVRDLEIGVSNDDTTGEYSTIKGTGTNTNIKLQPSGTGNVYIDSATLGNFWYLPNDRGSGSQETSPDDVLTINKETGQAYWRAPASSFDITDDGAVVKSFKVGTDSLILDGSNGVVTTVNKTGSAVTIGIRGTPASTSVRGVAKFDPTFFTVGSDALDDATLGQVTITAGSITNTQLDKTTIGIGNTQVELGSSASVFAGLNSISFSNLKIGAASGATIREKSTITTTTQNTSLYLTGNGINGKVWISGAYALPNVSGGNGQSLIVDNSVEGGVKWATPTTVLKFKGDEGGVDSALADSIGSVDLINGILEINGGVGLTTRLSDNDDKIIVNANIAGYSSAGNNALGVASFDSDFFTISAESLPALGGAVSIKANSITNEKLENSTFQFGTYNLSTNPAVALGATITGFKKLSTGITTSNLSIGESSSPNYIKSTNTDGGITFATDGAGLITMYGGADSWSIPNTRGTAANQVLTTNYDGTTSWATPVTTLTVRDLNPSPNIAATALISGQRYRITVVGSTTWTNGGASANTVGTVFTYDGDALTGSGQAALAGGEISIDLLSSALTFSSGVGNNITAAGSSVTINNLLADTDGGFGVATYNGLQFNLAEGLVSLKNEGVEDIVGDMIGNTNNISVTYDDNAANPGKLNFEVPFATSVTAGVATFDSGDFDITTGGHIALDGSVLKSIALTGGTLTPTNNSISLNGFIDGTGADKATSAIGITGSGTTITVKARLANATQTGVANFPTAQFSMTDGAVTILAATTSTQKGVANFNTDQFIVDAGYVETKTQNLGDQTIDLGGADITAINGLTQVTAGKIELANNTITYRKGDGAETNGNLVLVPYGALGSVSVSNALIKNLATPQDDNDAATKAYVDAARSGLIVKDPVIYATQYGPVPSANNNGVDVYGVVDLTWVSTAPVIDGETVSPGDRVLIKNQGATTNVGATDHVDNGIYIWYGTTGSAPSPMGDEILVAGLISGNRYVISTVGSTTWTNANAANDVPGVLGDIFVYDGTPLTGSGKAKLAGWNRSPDADQLAEVQGGMFTFVQMGTVWADTGWVLGSDGPITVGSEAQRFVQFSAAGTTVAGKGIKKTGQELSIDIDQTVGNNSPFTFTGNYLDVKSDFAGAGLTLTSGVLDVVGTSNRITVGENSIDISTSYVGQASITTLGTIGSGVWNATAVATSYGGTGLTSVNKGELLVGRVVDSTTRWQALSPSGNENKILQVNSAGDDILYADIDGGEY